MICSLEGDLGPGEK